uniref:RING-type domain-containing protein n=1 Tax=Taeniopygia guttata TaxID=59729 RepID=A0A674H4M5_TAEGU
CDMSPLTGPIMATETDGNCAICQDTLHDVASTQPCGHHFCRGCILQWIHTNPSCPLCREAIETVRFSDDAGDYLEIVITVPEQLPGAMSSFNPLFKKKKIKIVVISSIQSLGSASSAFRLCPTRSGAHVLWGTALGPGPYGQHLFPQEIKGANLSGSLCVVSHPSVESTAPPSLRSAAALNWDI